MQKENPATHRWREEAAGQLSRVESLRDGRPSTAFEVSVLRLLQACRQ